MGILITILLGALVGWLASKMMGADAEMGALENIIVGILGGFLGTALFGWFAPATPTDNGFSLGGIIVGVLGSCIIIWLWRVIRSR